MEKAGGNNRNKILFFYLLAVAVAAMFVLNWLTPLMLDDFVYRREGLSLGHILAAEARQYQSWSGRSVVHVLARIFLSVDKMWFNVLNALAFSAYIFLVYRMAGPKRRYNPALLLFALGLAWFTLPDFYGTVLWVTGACNYLWGSLIILLFLLPYREQLAGWAPARGVRVALAVFMPILGLLAGWCNENTSGAAILLAAGFMLGRRLEKKKTAAWMWMGLAGAVCGLGAMVLAPGNANRSLAFDNPGGMFGSLIPQMVNSLVKFAENSALLILAVAVLMALAWRRGEGLLGFVRRQYTSCCFVAAALAANFAMALAPAYPPRAAFGVNSFLAIAALRLAMDCDWQALVAGINRAMAKRVAAAGLLAVLGVSVVQVAFSAGTAYLEQQEFERQIQLARQAGQVDVVVEVDIGYPLIPETSRWVTSFHDRMQVDLRDYGPLVAAYYGVDSISLKAP